MGKNCPKKLRRLRETLGDFCLLRRFFPPCQSIRLYLGLLSLASLHMHPSFLALAKKLDLVLMSLLFFLLGTNIRRGTEVHCPSTIRLYLSTNTLKRPSEPTTQAPGQMNGLRTGKGWWPRAIAPSTQVAGVFVLRREFSPVVRDKLSKANYDYG
jgi:hypothetical protein